MHPSCQRDLTLAIFRLGIGDFQLMRKRRRFDTDRAFEILIWVMLLGSALAIGAVHPPVLAGTTAVVLLFSGLALSRYDLRLRSREALLLVVGLLVAGLCSATWANMR